MGKTFEDEFMDIQSGLISLCLEFADGKADKIFAFAAFDEWHRYFDAFFESKGKIERTNKIGNNNAKYIFSFLGMGIDDLEKFIEISKKYNRPVPVEMKMYYNVKNGRFNAEYRYRKDIPNYDTIDYNFTDTFNAWEKDLKARYEK